MLHNSYCITVSCAYYMGAWLCVYNESFVYRIAGNFGECLNLTNFGQDANKLANIAFC